MQAMAPMTFGLDPLARKTRKEVFLGEMNLVVSWGEWVALIQPPACILVLQSRSRHLSALKPGFCGPSLTLSTGDGAMGQSARR